MEAREVFVSGKFKKVNNTYTEWNKNVNGLYESKDNKGNTYFKKVKDGFVKMVDKNNNDYYSYSRDKVYAKSKIKEVN